MINILRKSIKEYQENQDLLYGIQKLSNEIRANSKKAIALLRRENIKESKKTIEDIENRFKLINEVFKQHNDLLNQNFKLHGDSPRRKGSEKSDRIRPESSFSKNGTI